MRSDETMQALVLPGWQQAPELREVPVPEPRPGEVLVRVAGAGACHSDLHLMEFPPGVMPFDPPFVLGHETTGYVAELGPGVAGLTLSQPVAVYGPWGCGHCVTCRTGAENYCEHAAELAKLAPGIGHDGGMAEYVRVPGRLLLPLGELDPVLAAPLTDAALTPYHAIKRSLPLLVPGSTVVVIGAGGLGHLAIQLVRTLTPSRIVVVDVAADKRRQALELGADQALDPGDDVEARVRADTAGLGAELVLDLVGSDATLALAARLARVRGHLTVVGIAGGSLPFSFFGLPYECSVASTYWGSYTELAEVIALARTGRIRAEVEEFPLARAVEAYDRMRAGTLNGRAVIIPGD
jgi:propanol-preferring alcohol dehydrogenase